MTTTRAPAVERLRHLPASERRAELESMVTEQFRAVLLIPDDEPVPLHESLFALGMSSVLIGEVQHRLSDLLGQNLHSSVLFNSCTVAQVIDYLTTDVLPDMFPQSASPPTALPTAMTRVLWDNVLHEMGAGAA